MIVLKNDKLRVVDAQDAGDIAQKTLDVFLKSAQEAISQKGSFKVAISGGKTPRHLYELLADSPLAAELNWDNIHIFWVDERCVSPESEDSNYKLASDTFLEKLPVVSANVHRIFGECRDYSSAVAKYEDVIREVFEIATGELPEFDLIILGMGPDGHIGSLLPNSYALFDTDDIASVVYQMDGGLDRITITHPVMYAAGKIVIMVSGSEKSDIVREVLLGKPDEVKYPVHTLWPILEKVLWIIDNDAAGKL